MSLLDTVRSDFHIHTKASFDTPDLCTVENIATIAHGLGIREIGLTDHVHVCSEGALGFDQKNTGREAHHELRDSINNTQWDLKVLFSWEADYFDGGRYSFDKEADPQNLDYLLLGHHFAWHMVSATDPEKARYIGRITMEMAKEPYANIIAHPFYYPGDVDQHRRIMSLLGDNELREIFTAMKESGKAAEITAYQFHANSRSLEFMKKMYSIAREAGVKFTLDSDAHNLGEMGSGYRCLHVLKELGFESSDFVDYAGLMALKESVC
ncbi:MAG: PHP domain-containing protein [Spirochaetales bacterium]|jgi:DNA polymerase (family X)|nr:PHP domain-containing protein [Spirochaetales bacterium]